MLHHLSPPGLECIIDANYGPELLAEPLLDSASPSPDLRAQAAGHSIMRLASFYAHARPAYVLAFKVRLHILDAPFSALPFLFHEDIDVCMDHLAWMRVLPDHVSQIGFEDCNLAVYLAAMRDCEQPPPLSINKNQLTSHEAFRIIFYKSDNLLGETWPDAFAGLDVVNHNLGTPEYIEQWRVAGVTQRL